MSLLAKVGYYIGELAAKYGISKIFTASLEIQDVKYEPIRFLGNSHDAASAVVYVTEVKNVGTKSAKNCRPHLLLEGVSEVNEFKGNYHVDKDVIDVNDKVKFDLDTQVYWRDNVQPADHFKSKEADVLPEKTISPGESSIFTFAIVVAEGSAIEQSSITFPSKSGFDPPSMPKLEIDGLAWVPPDIEIETNGPDRIGMPVEQFWHQHTWIDARIYVTCENAGRVESELEFTYDDGTYNIELMFEK